MVKKRDQGFAITEILVAASLLAIIALILNSSVIDYIKVAIQKDKNARTDSAAANMISNVSTGDNKAIISNFQPATPNGVPPSSMDPTLVTLMAKYPLMRANSSASAVTVNATNSWVLIQNAANKLLTRYIANGSQVCNGNYNAQLGKPLGAEIFSGTGDSLYPQAQELAGLNNARVFVRIENYDVINNTTSCNGQGSGLRLVPQGMNATTAVGLKVTTTIQHTDDSGNIKFNQSQAIVKPEADFLPPSLVTANLIPSKIRPTGCPGATCACDNTSNFCADLKLGNATITRRNADGTAVTCADTGSNHYIDISFAATERAVAFYCLVQYRDPSVSASFPAPDFADYKPCNNYSDGNVSFTLGAYPDDSSPYSGMRVTVKPASGSYFTEGFYRFHVTMFDSARNQSSQFFNFEVGIDLSRPTLSGTPMPDGSGFIATAPQEFGNFGRQAVDSKNLRDAISTSNLGDPNKLFQCTQNNNNPNYGWQLGNSNITGEKPVSDVTINWVTRDSGGVQLGAASQDIGAIYPIPALGSSGRYTVSATASDLCGTAAGQTPVTRDWYFDSGSTFTGTFWSIPDGVGTDNFMGGPQFGFSSNPEGSSEILDTYVWKLKSTGSDDAFNAGTSGTGRISTGSCTRDGSKGFCPRIFDGCGRRSVVTPPIFYQVLADTGQPCGTVKCGRSTDVCSRDTNTCVRRTSCMADSSCSSGATCRGCNGAGTQLGFCGGVDAGPSGIGGLPASCPKLSTASCGGATGTGDPATAIPSSCPSCVNSLGICQSNSDCCSGLPCTGGQCCVPNGSSGTNATCCSGISSGGICTNSTPVPPPTPTAPPDTPTPAPTPTPNRTPTTCVDEGGSCANGEVCCGSFTCKAGICVGTDPYVLSSDCSCTFNGKSVYSNSMSGIPSAGFAKDCQDRCWADGAIEANNFCADKTSGTKFSWLRSVTLNYNDGTNKVDPSFTGSIQDTCGDKAGKAKACCIRDSASGVPPFCGDIVRGDTMSKFIYGCQLSYTKDVEDKCQGKPAGTQISPSIWWTVELDGSAQGGEKALVCPSP